MRRLFIIFTLFLSLVLSADDGKDLYTANCMACHHMDKQVVGPSLIELAHFYKENPSGIVRWSLNPGVKRKLAIRMPPMTHLGKEKLLKVANYILKVTKGKKYKPAKEQEDPYKETAPAKLQRMFMPEAGPAAIALSLNENLHICWDAGTCQFRYAWNGKFIDQWPVWRGNGNALAKVRGETFTKVGQGNPFKGLGKPKFKGYVEKGDNYIFSYAIGDVDFTLTVTAISTTELSLNFTSNSSKPLEYQPSLEQGTWEATKGKISNGILKLSAKEAQSFSIIYKAEKK